MGRVAMLLLFVITSICGVFVVIVAVVVVFVMAVFDYVWLLSVVYIGWQCR